MSTRPGGEVAKRPLYFYWVIDTSDSMNDPPEKIGTLNCAAAEVVPDLIAEASRNPNAQVYVRRMKFSDQASWVENDPIKLENFAWDDIKADGKMTDMSLAYNLLTEELNNLPERCCPPVIVFLTDGQATKFSSDKNGKKALDTFFESKWAQKAVRIAIAIGHDADKKELHKFTKNVELIYEVHNSKHLAQAIKWASTIALKQSSRPSNIPINPNNEDKISVVPIPLPSPSIPLPPPTLPPLPDGDDDDDVF